MSWTENDLEQIETYLDGELETDEAVALRRRIAAEPELALAVDEARAARAAREAVWRGLEPTQGDVRAFHATVTRAMRRQETWERLARRLPMAGAAAACLLIGYFMGWATRTTPNGAVVPTYMVPSTEVRFSNERGGAMDAQRIDSPERVREFLGEFPRRDLHQRILPEGQPATRSHQRE